MTARARLRWILRIRRWVHALTLGRSAAVCLLPAQLGVQAEIRRQSMTHFERHEKLAAQIREAITRVVCELRFGESGYSLAGAAWNLNKQWKTQEAEDFEQGFIDDLVLAVGEVLTREGR